MTNRLIAVLLALTSLSGCFQDKQVSAPEDIALSFFQAIYVDNQPQLAMKLTSANIREVMEHYQLSSQIQRNLLGLALTETTVRVSDVDADFFRRRSDQTNVLIQLEGMQGGRLVREDRKIRLTHTSKGWIIDKLYDDPFTNNG